MIIRYKRYSSLWYDYYWILHREDKININSIAVALCFKKYEVFVRKLVIFPSVPLNLHKIRIETFGIPFYSHDSKISHYLTVKMCSLHRMLPTFQTEIYINHTRCISRFRALKTIVFTLHFYAVICNCWIKSHIYMHDPHHFIKSTPQNINETKIKPNFK